MRLNSQGPSPCFCVFPGYLYCDLRSGVNRVLFKNIQRVLVHACHSHVMSHLFLEEAAAAAAASSAAIQRTYNGRRRRRCTGRSKSTTLKSCTPPSNHKPTLVRIHPKHHHATYQCGIPSSSAHQMVQNQTWLSSQVHSGCFASQRREATEQQQQLPLPSRRPCTTAA